MPRRRIRSKIYSPRVWGTWLAIALGWLLSALPRAWHPALGHGLGRAAYVLAPSRRRIAQVNVALCFPELSPHAKNQLVHSTFLQLGVGLMEILLAWLHPKRIPHQGFRVVGQEHLAQALALNRGVILLGGHFAVMDIIGPTLAQLGPIDLMYRQNRDPVWEWLQMRGRRWFFSTVIERGNIRDILRSLRGGRAIWYAADQDYGRKHSVFAPFFGVSAATITATARLARLNDSPVLMLSQHRNADNNGWTLRFSPPLENFPEPDEVANAARINLVLEREILRAPEQYLWIHKRFKTRPEGEPSPYKR